MGRGFYPPYLELCGAGHGEGVAPPASALVSGGAPHLTFPVWAGELDPELRLGCRPRTQEWGCGCLHQRLSLRLPGRSLPRPSVRPSPQSSQRLPTNMSLQQLIPKSGPEDLTQENVSCGAKNCPPLPRRKTRPLASTYSSGPGNPCSSRSAGRTQWWPGEARSPAGPRSCPPPAPQCPHRRSDLRGEAKAGGSPTGKARPSPSWQISAANIEQFHLWNISKHRSEGKISRNGTCLRTSCSFKKKGCQI